MNSLRRMLDVLDLFKPGRPMLTVDAICAELGYTQASAYRYVRELTDTGLLVRLPRGYSLGPRVIELERQMTEYDPLLTGAKAQADDLVAQTGLDLLVSQLYGQAVINVFVKAASDSLPLRYGRGRPMNLFASSTARVVLAYLLPRQLRRLYDANLGHADLARLGATWKDFSRAMLQVRKTGYCISRGELDPKKSGISAPIFDDGRRILGSITLLGATERFDAFNEAFLANLIVDAATRISEGIAANA